MATKKKSEEVKADPVGVAVDPVPVEVLDIPATEPYPTGDPKGPQTWAEINGLVPVGTGPLQPAPEA
jgi:hypothetical protein